MVPYEALLERLNAQLRIHGHLLGVVSGAGLTARYAMMGGADFLLALSSGRCRIMGRGSYAGYYCYGNSNEITMEFGTRELLPILPDAPVLFGIAASDPFIHLYEYLKEIKARGFSGVTNFPTMALIDGKFRMALEEDGNSYEREVEAIGLAHHLGLFTAAFVTKEEEADAMLRAGADVICVHLGLTKGGFMGAKKYISIAEAKHISDRIFALCARMRPEVIRMIYAGPANTPMDVDYLYRHTAAQGYIGGSTFDRIPAEKVILQTVRAFKNAGTGGLSAANITAEANAADAVDFVKNYVHEHYGREIRLRDLAIVLHISPSYLSTLFKQDTGMSFTSFLLSYRMERARALLAEGRLSCREVAEHSGYPDYAQFSKMFRKYQGMSPSDVLASDINTSPNSRN
ncbi:phosphoenolpyruvate hydrolase family protein [Selenomonas sp. TAMA-11512]|uniref:phosphoenolpyruvate hydrolase family protein n=1 Tax=Selenomonas sp. TAMA-11512 TaxID=3095337 RepID=UPI00308C6555|nr:phosphoenolpyruvate hydrolase family protein [Selenomonas sp. TAMA-11512]